MSIVPLKDGSTVRTYQASSGGTGYASGDVLLFITPKIQTNPVTTGNTYWMNAGPGANAELILPAAPSGGTFAEITIGDIVEQTTLGDILRVIAGPLSVSGNSSGTPYSPPVSGTVTANQGTAAVVGNAWPVKVSDGTNFAAVKAASTAAVAADKSAVVQLSPNGIAGQILAAITAQSDFAEVLLVDPGVSPNVFYIRRETNTGGTIVVQFLDMAGTVVVPPDISRLIPAASGANYLIQTDSFYVTVADANYSIGDYAQVGTIYSTTTNPPTQVAVTWRNVSQGTNPGVAPAGFTSNSNALTDDQLRASAVPVSLSAVPLPTGAATSDNQTNGAQLTGLVSGTVIAIDQGIPGTTNLVQIGGTLPDFANNQVFNLGTIGAAATEATLTTLLTDTQLRASPVPVSLASTPLPTGAATEAKQDDQITQETAIAGSVATLAANSATLGQKNMAGSAPVVIASDQSALLVAQSGTWSVGRTWTLAFGTDSVTIGAALPAGSNTIGSVTQASGPWSENLTQINSVSILTGVGAVGTGCQRFAIGQDVTTIAGAAPGTAGTPSANVVSIQGVSGGTALPISQVATATTNRSGTVTLGGTSQQLAASNAARKRIFIQNPSAQTEVLYIDFGASASTTPGTSIELLPGGSYDSAGAPPPSDAINVTATTTSHPFIAKEW